jgi:zinc protease
LQSQQVNRAEDGWLVRALTTRDYDSRTMAFDADLEKKVAALTPDDVVQALRRHIDLARFSIVKAGDFKSLGTAK